MMMGILGADSVAPTTSASAAFIARTSGLTETQKGNYISLIDGLVNDGVFSKFDALYVFAAPDSATALLNLVSSSFPCVAHGSPTFTANVGFTGVDASSTVYLDTQFNPTTAGSPKAVENSHHFSAWSNTNAASTASGGCIIGTATAATGQTTIFPRYSDNNTYCRATDGNAGVAAASGQGHFITNRSASNANQGYRNGANISVPSDTSQGNFANGNIFVLAYFDAGTSGANVGFGGQCCSASIGSSLSSTDATNLYNRLRTYMTAVGVP